MGRRKHRDIEIRGEVYPTVQAAAAAQGVTEGAVLRAIRLGTLHRVGIGASFPVPMPIRIRGEVFADARAAGEKFGRKPAAIRRAVAEGREDLIGVGRRYNSARARPIELGGRQFRSMADASRALGRNAEYVSHVLSQGGKQARESLIGAIMRLEAGARHER